MTGPHDIAAAKAEGYRIAIANLTDTSRYGRWYEYAPHDVTFADEPTRQALADYLTDTQPGWVDTSPTAPPEGALWRHFCGYTEPKRTHAQPPVCPRCGKDGGIPWETLMNSGSALSPMDSPAVIEVRWTA